MKKALPRFIENGMRDWIDHDGHVRTTGIGVVLGRHLPRARLHVRSSRFPCDEDRAANLIRSRICATKQKAAVMAAFFHCVRQGALLVNSSMADQPGKDHITRVNGGWIISWKFPCPQEAPNTRQSWPFQQLPYILDRMKMEFSQRISFNAPDQKNNGVMEPYRGLFLFRTNACCKHKQEPGKQEQPQPSTNFRLTTNRGQTQ
ncbi:MAG: hypothetical protein LBI87_07495 [Candidatus Accumulibacter sp.]|jgi:hypothetical protein|nr:hypothetical protein [Accumulibacter sp.]